MAHCIPCSMSTNASHVAKMFHKEIVRLQGLPTSIASDRDVQFVSYFLKTLGLFGTNLKFSSAFHPHTDGQTEVINHSLGELFRWLVGGKLGNWDLLLPKMKFADNNSVNRSMGKNLFELVHGFRLTSLLIFFLCHLSTFHYFINLILASHISIVT